MLAYQLLYLNMLIQNKQKKKGIHYDIQFLYVISFEYFPGNNKCKEYNSMYCNIRGWMLFTGDDSKRSWMVFQCSPALREWESVGIWLRPLGNVAYVACLPLLCQGSKWLNGKSIWLVFRRYWVWIPAGSQIFFPWIYFTPSQPKNTYCNILISVLKPLPLWRLPVCWVLICVHFILFA